MQYNFKQNLLLVSTTFCILLLLLSFDSALSLQKEPDKTITYLHKFEHASFNGGQNIVFQGKLTTEFGDRIPYATIIIKNDGPCPKNYVMAEGITDKHGRFWISTIAKDGMNLII